MTGRPTTADDLKATLNTIEQALAQAETVNVDAIAGQLNVLYTAAEQRADEPAMLAISQTWDHVQLVAQQAEQSRQAALTAIDIAQTTQNQHLITLKELETLSDALENMDSDHPLVNELIESVQEEIYERQVMWEDDTYGDAQWEKREEYCFALKHLTGHTDKTVAAFFDILDGEHRFTAEQLDMLKKLLDSLAATRPISDKFGFDAGDDYSDDEDGDVDD